MTTFASDKQVAERFGVARTTVWRWVNSVPHFPKPIALTPGCTRWRLDELEAWERARVAK
ncbi:transcriptional regulator, AlpA family [Palleronia salina]|uniref:Transcriptional regulator, AlpA family n=1 Tax=Palleronia salina TaxID=313368 RepID=A0A1M6M2J2_9RHOB|nr:transcriptional regulator, AlpA family [Palleronia salina]